MAKLREEADVEAPAKDDLNLENKEPEHHAGRQMYVGRLVQNMQFEARAKGVQLGAISPRGIFELVESGVIGNWPSVQSLRRMLRDAD